MEIEGTPFSDPNIDQKKVTIFTTRKHIGEHIVLAIYFENTLGILFSHIFGSYTMYN